MTRLFNLESYIDACQYARVFQDSSYQLVSQTRETYKFLLDKYAEHRYLLPPIINNHHSSQLTINPSKLDYLSMGTELTQGEKPRLFIISDTLDLMTLSTSNILGRRDGYLYSSAYYYWNYYTEINQHLITKPLVFINLDNFGILTLIPIKLIQPENSHYKIPILDTRNKIHLDHSYDCIGTYTKICNSVAGILLNQFSSLSINNETVEHLSGYLQKINFFQLIQSYVNQESVNLIIEINNNNQIFCKQVTISISEIANILCQHINFDDINQLENQYPQYQFILVSQYNIFEKIKTYLPNFICPHPSYQQFPEIWTEKNHLNFPLFAIYLDEIKFAVAIYGKKEWIKLSDEKDAISYEGKPTVLIGSIPSLKQDFVRIPQGRSSANLPIRVNAHDYCINGIPQDYKIEIENYQGTEEIRVQIQFNLQPGSFPELKVRDLENKYKIKTSFVNTEQTNDSTQKYYSHILPEQITANRQQRSLSQIERLKRRNDFQDFINDLNHISSTLDKISKQGYTRNNYNSLNQNINNAKNKINQQPDLLQFIDISSIDIVVIELIATLNQANLSRLVDIVYNTLTSNQPLNTDKKDLLVYTIMFTGKLYRFSEYLLSDRLFFQLQLQFNNAINIRGNLSNEYLQCLARIAENAESQRQYFSLFDSQYNLEISQYLWGYGNILLWYYDFNSSELFLDYQHHFTKIMNYLLSKYYTRFSDIYKKFAFLSLIYLLTFRAHDSKFCCKDSQEFQLANKVIEHFQHDRIMLNTVSREKPLNQYFQEMIEGTSTANEIENLLQVPL
ncbi:hypothetical protein MEN41_01095 [Dolichospermum sp. ST_con]|nr:hypothetical protein [Dolichospermum sp. ST_con]MDD1417902.1 hypothetical protein [Dolichospermum sp. ST_sed1]MDD1423849.1 hypothetical protein [Dolichospermum sp. ST_sed9]MDD1429681.1 hypothetical protein [Dolichospermum sp. ST_sed6]MDD1435997.1 hypothetical protein [Dolichospermum sp. ST_sed10]MDD1439288.1 hypothetical protein [Dolichospermum sp. ST_sed3]MDD1445070.1 hypothetical protein [Dolichospermum sp. ST_sed8]MDD1456067.1 hypothetical protein [Dolichospermum sp. ST_sed7]MDD145927